jgi:hypothetical protein
MTTLLVDVYCCAIAAVVVAIIVVCTTRCSVSRVSLSVGGLCVLLHNPYECLGCLKLLDTQVVSLSRRECRMGPRILRLGCRSRMQIHHKGRTFLRHPAHKELGGC